MKKLGISIYPNISNDLEKDKEYLLLAKQFGFTRLFMSLLNIENNEINRFIKISQFAKELGYEIIFDLSPEMMNILKINYDNLNPLKDLGASGIRLDESFDGYIEAKMTYQDLLIELNASVDDGLIQKVIENFPNKENLITCHNFYPLRYTGLSIDHFMEMTTKIKKHRLKTAAFITSQNENTFGPWNIKEGLCTLECHRDLPIDVQLKHYLTLDNIDNIIIANAYASYDELKACQDTLLMPHTLHIETLENSVIEDKIIDEHHLFRKDRSEFVIRSTMPRIIYHQYHIYPKNNRKLYKGDIVIINDHIERYKGELQIILKDIKNDGRYNIVGRIPKNEHLLIEELHKWNEIKFIRRD